MVQRSTIFGTLSRYAAIFGLLVTLFVSSGEGVRLFPIPVDGEVRSETSDAAYHDKDSYCVGIQTARNVSANQRTKHAGDVKIVTAGAFAPYIYVETLTRVSLAAVAEFPPRPSFASDPSIASHSGRAPPIA
jgi:hypothetical protein